MERPDGNNVSLDREGLLMSETQLQYQIGIQLIKQSVSPDYLAPSAEEVNHESLRLIIDQRICVVSRTAALRVIAANMANAETTHTEAGGPFSAGRCLPVAGASSFKLALANTGSSGRADPGSVQISEVVDDPTPPVMRYEPGHPDANKDGYVAYPAINPAMEMVDLMGSVRAYQLNASAVPRPSR
jgi:flagellar basal-body rod protein FlgC